MRYHTHQLRTHHTVLGFSLWGLDQHPPYPIPTTHVTAPSYRPTPGVLETTWHRLKSGILRTNDRRNCSRITLCLIIATSGFQLTSVGITSLVLSRSRCTQQSSRPQGPGPFISNRTPPISGRFETQNVQLLVDGDCVCSPI